MMVNHLGFARSNDGACEPWLEIGEVLPGRWMDFLEPLTGKSA